MTEINQRPELTSEDKAFIQIAKVIQAILRPKDEALLLNNNNSHSYCPPCCCPKFLKFKIIGCTVIIINDNAACKKT